MYQFFIDENYLPLSSLPGELCLSTFVWINIKLISFWKIRFDFFIKYDSNIIVDKNYVPLIFIFFCAFSYNSINMLHVWGMGEFNFWFVEFCFTSNFSFSCFFSNLEYEIIEWNRAMLVCYRNFQSGPNRFKIKV